MYCNCLNKKKIVTTIAFNQVEVCSKNLGGCGKEISSLVPSNTKILITRDMINKNFRTRGGDIVKLTDIINVTEYPCVFELSGITITTTIEGVYRLNYEHNYDIMEILK